MFKTLERWLEKAGRKYVLADHTGNILGFKYFPLFKESFSIPFLFPNVIIHYWVHKKGVDQYSHSHPWSFLSVMIKGGYTEVRDGVERKHNGFSIIYLPYNKTHIITDVIPGTVTIFFHGFKRSRWVMFEKDGSVMESVSFISDGVSKWKGLLITKWGSEVRDRIYRRKRAFNRV